MIEIMVGMLLAGSNPAPTPHIRVSADTAQHLLPFMQCLSNGLNGELQSGVARAEAASRQAVADRISAACRKQLPLPAKAENTNPDGIVLAQPVSDLETAVAALEKSFWGSYLDPQSVMNRASSAGKVQTQVEVRAVEDGSRLPPVQSLSVPHEILPQFKRYVDCVTAAYRDSSSQIPSDAASIHRANAAALARCKDTKADALAKSHVLIGKSKLYGSASQRRALVEAVFDGFDQTYEVVDARGESSDNAQD